MLISRSASSKEEYLNQLETTIEPTTEVTEITTTTTSLSNSVNDPLPTKSPKIATTAKIPKTKKPKKISKWDPKKYKCDATLPKYRGIDLCQSCKIW